MTRRRLSAALTGLLMLGLVALALQAIWQRPTPPAPLPGSLAGRIDHLLVEKSARRLTAYRAGQPLKTYRIALGFAPVGDKQRQGDGRTPEGLFRINRRNDASAFHLSLGIDYPQQSHLIAASTGGYDPGGDIFLHGQPNALPDALTGGSTLARDWTAGCIALSNAEIAELWHVTRLGTTEEIRP